MRYLSTRGGVEPVSFSEAVAQGLAPDGGLYLPETFPDLASELNDWASLSYPDLCHAFFRKFATDLDDEEAPTKRGADAPGAHAHGGAPQGRARGHAGEHKHRRQGARRHCVSGRAAHAREAVQQRGRRADHQLAMDWIARPQSVYL